MDHSSSPEAYSSLGNGAFVISLLFAVVLLSPLASVDASAETLGGGGDTYLSGANVQLDSDAAGDVFLAGSDVVLEAEVAGDAHLAGFSVSTRERVGGDLYLAGGSVSVAGAVADDLTASGFAVRLRSTASVGGNTRVAGGTVTVSAPLEGSLLVAGGTVNIDAPISGDVKITASEIEFGEQASIGGRLQWSASSAPHIPRTVIDPARVEQLPLGDSGMIGDVGETIEDAIPQFWPSLTTRITALLMLLGFLLTLAAILFAFAPNIIEGLRARALAHPGLSLLAGATGLAALIGALPVAAITLVGIPFVPIILLALVVLWILGYALGLHVIATRVWRAFDGTADGLGTKLATLGVALIAIALLNFVPIIGWLANLAVVLLGLGAMSLVASERLTARSHAA